MIKYAIPGLYYHHELNFKLLNLMEKNPNMFYPNIEIEAVYGVFPWSILDGGRIFPQSKHVTTDEIKRISEKYNDFNVAVRLVCTNSQLTEKHFNDRFSNLMLELCNKKGNQIVVANDKLLEYIKTKYKNYEFISSTTKCLKKEDFIKELSKDFYSEVCLDYNLNTNLELLNSLYKVQKEKCEFLCNAICPPSCPTRKHHYKLNSLYQLQYGREYGVPYCGISGSNISCTTRNYTNNFSYDKILNVYEPMGFQHFKLEGRTLPTEVQAIIYGEYMAKPEYKDELISQLLAK